MYCSLEPAASLLLLFPWEVKLLPSRVHLLPCFICWTVLFDLVSSQELHHRTSASDKVRCCPGSDSYSVLIACYNHLGAKNIHLPRCPANSRQGLLSSRNPVLFSLPSLCLPNPGFCQQDKHVQHENEVAFIFKLRRKNKVSRKNFLKFKNLPRSFLKTLKSLILIMWIRICCCSVAKSCLTLQPLQLQHTRPPCSSLSPGVSPSSGPLSQWCHPTISSSITLFSFCLQSFPASGSFPMSRLFTSGGQTFGASASASILPINIQCWFPLGLTDLIS